MGAIGDRVVEEIGEAIADPSTLTIQAMEKNATVISNISSSSSFPSSAVKEATSLTILDKGILNWSGSFEDLRYLVEDLQISKAKWTSPGGDCKLYEGREISIRWYSKKGTLTVNGENADVVKDKLVKIVEKVKESKCSLISEPAEVLNNNENLHVVTDNDNSLGKEATHPSEFTGHDLKRMEEFKDSINAKVDPLVSEFRQLENEKMDYLVKEINILKTKESCSCSLLKVEELQNKNERLKTECNILQERNNNLAYVVSDLNTRIKDLENERLSLVTTIKLLQLDYRNVEDIADLSKENKAWTKVGNSSSKVTEKIGRKNFNRFSVLTLEDSEDSNNDEDDNNKDDDKKLIPIKMRAKSEKAAKACQPGKLSSKPNDKLEDMNHSIPRAAKRRRWYRSW